MENAALVWNLGLALREKETMQWFDNDQVDPWYTLSFVALIQKLMLGLCKQQFPIPHSVRTVDKHQADESKWVKVDAEDCCISKDFSQRYKDFLK